MKLNHLDLQVADVQRCVDFFERIFDLELQSSRTSPAIAILGDRHGFVLVLQRRKSAEDAYPEGFHIGFLVDDVEAVHRAHDRIQAANVHVTDVEVNARGTMIYCRAPDGFSVEVSCRRSRPDAPAAATGGP